MREVLDLYVDGELSAEATDAARRHLSECAACRRTEQQLLLLRKGVQAAVAQYQPPPQLQQWVHTRFGASRTLHRIAVMAACAIAVIALALALSLPWGRGFVASLLERFAFQIDGPRTVELEGRVICRDCELKRVYGKDTIVASQGHGALETSDGKIWNFMQNAVSAPLIEDKSLQGKLVRIRGTIYRRAGCVEVESYQVLSARQSG
jgi:hypothetical protein